MKSTAAKASLVFAGLLFSFALLAPSSHSLLGLRQHSEVDGWRQGDSHTSLSPISDKRVSEVFNETLGFQDVFLLSLPSRSDRRDSFTLQASLSNISFKIMDGVDAGAVPLKTRPYTFEQNNGRTGAWRSHLNIMQHIVHNNIPTAIIFEDDTDWDVAFKYQLAQMARGSQWLLNQSQEIIPDSPYGDGWDLLWIGDCATNIAGNDKRRWVIPKDPTVVPPDRRYEWEKPDMHFWEEDPVWDTQTRVVFTHSTPLCTWAYGVSLSGARKILYRLSLVPFNDSYDTGVQKMCETRDLNFSCIGVYPSIVGNSFPAGGTNRQSDIDGPPEADPPLEQAISGRIVFSTRLNLVELIEGKTRFRSQFPEATGAEMEIGEIGGAIGHAEVLDEAEEEERGG